MDINKLIQESLSSQYKRYTVDDLPSNLVLLTDEYTTGEGYGKFFLYNTDNKRCVGFIVFGETVDRVYSETKGFGSFLFESAMTHLYPSGLSVDRSGSTTESALNVFRRFMKRDDIKKEKLPTDVNSYNRLNLPNSKKYKDKPEVIQEIFELEDTNFIYSYGKDKLQKLIDIGRKYAEDNLTQSVDSLEINIDFGEDDY